MPPKRKAQEGADHSDATPRTSRSQPQLLPLSGDTGPNPLPEAPPKPFVYIGNLADLRLENISTAFPELSQAQQHMDLWTVFTMPHHDTADEIFAAWWEAKPRPHEVYSWGWGHPAEHRRRNRRSGWERTLQAVTTFRAMGEEAQRLGLKEVEMASAVKEMDYIMLMLLQHWLHLPRIPEAEERLRHLFARLRPEDQAMPSAGVIGRGSALGNPITPRPLAYDFNGPDPQTDSNEKVGSFFKREFQDLPKVVGCVEAQEALEDALCHPILFPHLLDHFNGGSTGILLFGPPGTGKTLTARSMAQQHGWNYYEVSAADLQSEFVGDTEKLIRNLFSEALANSPSVIFMDDVDGLLGARTGEESDSSRRSKSELIIQWDRLDAHSRVMVVGATNKPKDIDPAFRRRFQTRIRVSAPDVEALKEMLVLSLQKIRHCISEAQVGELATLCKGYTGSDLNDMIQTLSRRKLRELVKAQSFRQASAALCTLFIKLYFLTDREPA